MAELPANLTGEPGREGKRLLVLGCGNLLAGDDSAGAEVVRRLSSSKDQDCDFLDVPHPGVELLEVLLGAGAVLIVDAVASGAPPGTLHLIPWPAPSIEPRAVGALSSHGWGPIEMLKLAAALGRALPPVVILGIEIGQLRPGMPRCGPVESAVARIVETFPKLRSLLANPQAALWDSARTFSPEDFSFPGK